MVTPSRHLIRNAGGWVTPRDPEVDREIERAIENPKKSDVNGWVVGGAGAAGFVFGGMFGGIGAALTHVTDVDAYHSPRASVGGGALKGALGLGALFAGAALVSMKQ